MYYLQDEIKDKRVLAAMEKIPRHRFVPLEYAPSAYINQPLPIGHGQTISQPYIVALMSELLALNEDDRVLEIGTGSGYQTAVLAELVKEVYTIEVIESLSEKAKHTLTSLGYDNINFRVSDGYFGWKEKAPFDAIIVTAAAAEIPPALKEQLAESGSLVIPIGMPGEIQTLMKIDRDAGDFKTIDYGAVRFVPFTREVRTD